MTHCFYCRAALEGHQFTAREMMFGTRDQFEYIVCSNCGSCMLLTSLDSFDLSSHYPANYYSFNVQVTKQNPLMSYFKKRRGQHLFGSPNLLGAVMQRVKPFPDVPQLTKFDMNTANSVLDVGAGSGAFLACLREGGFSNRLHGCDPFIPDSITTDDFQVMKQSLLEVTGQYDFIFFNHSFEHLLDPVESITAARRLQNAGGRCVVRIPTTSSWAFERYGTNWIQLDPPRHISIPSRQGMRLMAEAAGYTLVAMIDDSTAFQFWGSEQYLKDIPLRAYNSYEVNPQESAFSPAEIAVFEREANRANAAQKGDQTAFILQAV